MTVTSILFTSIIIALPALFFFIYKKILFSAAEKLIIMAGAPLLALFSFFVVERKIGGTVMYNSHGWPHFYLPHTLKDILEGTIIDKWHFTSGFGLYFASDLIFYFSLLFCAAALIRLAVGKRERGERIAVIALLTVTVAGSLALIFSNKLKEIYIKQAIEKANYCQIDSDCVDAGGACPFGCYAFVNKNERARIAGLVNSFNSNCVYSCVYCSGAVCSDNKCRPVCETPARSEAKEIKLPLKEELADCLPKSDMASKEKCDRLLLQIVDYEGCADAGFDIMKSEPPKCQTPDGRIFVEGEPAESAWED